MERCGIRKSRSMWSLETLGRVCLSQYPHMREFLYSEIRNIHRIDNIPEDPDLAIETGKVLCETQLDPLAETFGHVAIRSGYRAPGLNRFGNENGLNGARNDHNWGRHIWDQRDGDGRRGACTSLFVPWFSDQYALTPDRRDLAFWLKDHLHFYDVWFFPKLCAFNLGLRDDPAGRVFAYIALKGELTGEPSSAHRHADFQPFRGVHFPKQPGDFHKTDLSTDLSP
ncbi:MAG: hypothetical protein ACI81Q_002159 [Paracoccaceae bacterium]|jgi:hypothetical protein